MVKNDTSITISWKDEGTISGSVFTEGASHLVTLDAEVEPSGSGSYIKGTGGDIIKTSWNVVCAVFTESKIIPDGGKISFLNRTFIILRIFTFEKHVEIKC